jgi:hypothetical protein
MTKPVYVKTQNTRLAGLERKVRFLERREQIPNGMDLGGDGIQFDVSPQDGGFLRVTTTDHMDIENAGAGQFILENTGDGEFSIYDDHSGLNIFSGFGVIVQGDGDNGVIIRASGDGDLVLETVGAAQLRINGLPTSDPGGSGLVWNDGGTLKIT